MAHKVDQSKCISCGTCDMECPFHAIVISPEGKFSVNVEKCVDCDLCSQACPVDAIFKDIKD